MQDFRNLTVWQAARRVTQTVYELTSDFPQNEEFGIKAQMRRASVSICSNIAEGCGRSGDRSNGRFQHLSRPNRCRLA
jgi:four helix bundle protein